MNRNIFKAHLEEILRQLSNENIHTDKEKKSRLLIGLEIQIEMCNLITSKYNKDYSKEKEFFSNIQGFVLLDNFVQAINCVSNELNRVINFNNSNAEDYI